MGYEESTPWIGYFDRVLVHAPSAMLAIDKIAVVPIDRSYVQEISQQKMFKSWINYNRWFKLMTKYDVVYLILFNEKKFRIFKCFFSALYNI